MHSSLLGGYDSPGVIPGKDWGSLDRRYLQTRLLDNDPQSGSQEKNGMLVDRRSLHGTLLAGVHGTGWGVGREEGEGEEIDLGSIKRREALYSIPPRRRVGGTGPQYAVETNDTFGTATATPCTGQGGPRHSSYGSVERRRRTSYPSSVLTTATDAVDSDLAVVRAADEAHINSLGQYRIDSGTAPLAADWTGNSDVTSETTSSTDPCHSVTTASDNLLHQQPIYSYSKHLLCRWHRRQAELAEAAAASGSELNKVTFVSPANYLLDQKHSDFDHRRRCGGKSLMKPLKPIRHQVYHSTGLQLPDIGGPVLPEVEDRDVSDAEDHNTSMGEVVWGAVVTSDCLDEKGVNNDHPECSLVSDSQINLSA